jgi:TetR/AcrR family transcriptional regulator, transcriptional repressor for nem operon
MMRRSRSEAAETRERILSTAVKMFLDRGVAAVSMRDIMAAAGLTPGGFYRHFESKEQLLAEANGAAFEQLFAMMESQIAGKPPAEALDRIVSLYLGQSREKGNIYCPLSMMGIELSHCDEQVRALATDGYKRLARMVADRLTHLSKAEAAATASGLASTMVGAVTLANVTADRATALSILSNAQALIRARLFPADGGPKTRAANTRQPRRRS